MGDSDKLQADGGGGHKGAPDGVNEATGAGESGGGAYPNPHSGHPGPNDPGSFLGHGGQSEIAYHGPGQLGDEKTGEDR